MKIGFIPIDNRPVCYTLPKLISEIDDDIKLYMPNRGLLGDLTKCTDVNGILAWLESLEEMDAFVISLDTIAYGGLIPSRRSLDSYDDILERIEKLKNIIAGKKVYAFSSIMRISNNNVNQEEKSYWDKWGKKIFEYSWNCHKNNSDNTDIPLEILEDYLATRKRNFDINKVYLKWQKEGIFNTLIFSKDDCAEYGFNVKEANILKSQGATVKTGADEIPLSLLARAIVGKVKISPIFLEDNQKYLISNYEDISIKECVENQIELAGCEVSERDLADVELYVNNFKQQQGEIVMKIPTMPFEGKWTKPCKSYAIADVRYANGSDNEFVKAVFAEPFGENFLGYSAWNTSANSLGSLIFAIKLSILSIKKNTFNKNAFNKLMLTRFLDDWAYQANVRQSLNMPDTELLKFKMLEYEKILLEKFPSNYKINYKFPWNRLFEVEVDFI